MKNNVIETVMGALVLAIAGFFLAFAYNSSGYHDKAGQIFLAKFNRVDGLQVGNDVRMSGVKVGIVRSMTIDPKTFMAKIQLSVDDTLKVPTDSSAEIVTDGLLGGKYVAIVPGGDEEVLASGQEIVHTQASISLEAMIGQLIFSNKKDDKSHENTPSGKTS